jgi:hypothetical protein
MISRWRQEQVDHKGSLSDSHYNILDKKASDYIELLLAKFNGGDF